MLNTYIKNRGKTTTLIHKNNNNQISELNWDADYDGDVANIAISSETNGKKKYYDIQLDNNDLASILSLHSVNTPIDKRLKIDFKTPSYKAPLIELPQSSSIESSSLDNFNSKNSFLSSPKIGEEIIIPYNLNNKTTRRISISPKHSHKHKKNHITYKVHKRTRSNKKSKKKTSSNKRTYRNTPKPKSRKHKRRHRKSKSPKSTSIFF